VPNQPYGSDPDIARVLKQIDKRQARDASASLQLDPEKLAFDLMRRVPRKHWRTPWPQIPGATSQNPMSYPFNIWHPGLKKLTPDRTIEMLFNLPGMIREEQGRRATTSKTQ
jgi:hypothetical protein